MKTIAIAATLVFAVASSTVFAQGQPSQQRDFRAVEGAYVGGAIGAFGAKATGIALEERTAGSKNGIGGKLFVGYQLTENFGAELGFIRSSTLKRTYVVGTTNVEQKGEVNALYVAGTGRFAFGERFAVAGKVGVARGKFSGTNALPTAAAITGSKTGAIFGVGAEYRFTPKIAATLDYDYLPKTSNRLKSAVISAGVKFTF
jgi:OmpA-OmpF porin, OOP family